MMAGLRRSFGRGQDQGFTLIELLIVVLIVGILAAVAAPIYVGYVKDAKFSEGKSVAGTLWTALQSNAIGNCGTATDASTAFTKAGLSTTGVTNPLRWSVKTTSTLLVNCSSGVYTPGGTTLFVIDGAATDVSSLSIAMVYNAANTPPSNLTCRSDGTDAGATDPKC